MKLVTFLAAIILTASASFAEIWMSPADEHTVTTAGWVNLDPVPITNGGVTAHTVQDTFEWIDDNWGGDTLATQVAAGVITGTYDNLHFNTPIPVTAVVYDADSPTNYAALDSGTLNLGVGAAGFSLYARNPTNYFWEYHTNELNFDLDGKGAIAYSNQVEFGGTGDVVDVTLTHPGTYLVGAGIYMSEPRIFPDHFTNLLESFYLAEGVRSNGYDPPENTLSGAYSKTNGSPYYYGHTDIFVQDSQFKSVINASMNDMTAYGAISASGLVTSDGNTKVKVIVVFNSHYGVQTNTGPIVVTNLAVEYTLPSSNTCFRQPANIDGNVSDYQFWGYWIGP